MSGQRLSDVLFLGLCALYACCDSPAVGQPPARTDDSEDVAYNVRHLYVPGADPEAWPPGDWVPVATQELRNFLKPAARRSSSVPEAFLERAVYRARFSGESLHGGTLEAVARLRTKRPSFTDLGTPSLFLHALKWPATDAVWGSSPDGRMLLRIEENGRVLTGQWSLAGRRVFDDVTFDVSVPPAGVSQFEIELPKNAHLLVEGALASQVSLSRRSGWSVWSIDLGHRTSFRMTVVPGDESRDSMDDQVVASQVAQYSLRSDGLHLQADLTIAQIGADRSFLEFLVPGELRLSPVTFGSELVLPVKRTKKGASAFVQVDVRGLNLVAGTTIRVRGKLPISLGEDLTLPSLDLPSGRWLRTQRSLTIVRPLELVDVRASGCRLVGSSLDSEGGDTLEYEDVLQQSEITVRVDQPDPNISATVVSHVRWGDGDPLLRSAVLLRTISGSTFTVECRVPSDWEVTKLESTAAAPVAQWRHSPAEDGDRGLEGRLVVEFRKPLSPQLAAELVVWCRQSAPASTALTDASIVVPSVLPVVAGDREVWLVAESHDGIDFDLHEESFYERMSFSALNDEWGGLLPEVFSPSDRDRMLVLRADNPPEGTDAVVSPRLDLSSKAGDASASSEYPNDLNSLKSLPLVAPLSVETTVAINRGSLCRNRATFEFPETSIPQELTFELPSTAMLISAQVTDMVDSPTDGSRILHAEGGSVRFVLEPSSKQRRVVIRYDSPLRRQLISGNAQVPLPQWNGQTPTVAWDVVLPANYRIGSATDGTCEQDSTEVSWSQRLFGPLGRAGGGEVSTATWQSFISPEGDDSQADDARQEIRVRRSLAGHQPALSLTFWSVTRARRAAWATLAIGLLLASWPFGKQRPLGRSSAPAIVILGLVLALLSPDALAIPFGGFTIGTILGLLVPEDWRVRSFRHVRRSEESVSQSPQAVARLSSISVVLLACFIAWNRSLPAWQTADPVAKTRPVPLSSAQPSEERLDVLVPMDPGADRSAQPPPIVYVLRTQLQSWSPDPEKLDPPYLVRSASYHVREFESTTPLVSADYDVVLLHPDEMRHVFLPVTGAVFSGADACLVDGVATTLLPHQGGQGVVVDLSQTIGDLPDGRRASSEIESSAYERSVQILLEFRPRASNSADGPRLRIGIPAVADSQATFRVGRPDPPAIAVAHRGTSSDPKADGIWRVALGGVNELVADPATKRPLGSWLAPKFAVSRIESRIRQHHVASRLLFDVDPDAMALSSSRLLLTLPPHALVHDVRCPGLNDVRIDATDDRPVRLSLMLEGDESGELAVEVDFDLSVPEVDEQEVVIPALPFLEESQTTFPVHYIGISAAPGFKIAASEPSGGDQARDAVSEYLAEWPDSRPVRTPDVARILNSPRPVTIPLSLTVPEVEAAISQTLTISESGVDWTADLDVTVRGAPMLVHRFAIDPRLRIEQVSVMQDGAERLAKWSQPTSGEMTVFLAGQFAGSQTLHLQGALDVQERQGFTIPMIKLRKANLIEPPTTFVRHAADLSVEVLSGDNVIQSSERTVTAADVRLIEEGPYRDESTAGLLTVRLSDLEDEWTLDQVTTLSLTDVGVIEQVSQWRSSTHERQPDLIDIVVESLPDSFETESSLPVEQQVREPGGETLLKLTRALGAPRPLTLRLHGKLESSPPSSWKLPSITVSDGRIRSQYVAVRGRVAIELPDAAVRRVDLSDLPQWFRSQESASADDWSTWQLIDPRESIEATYLGNAAAAVRTLSSAVWQQSDGSWRGVTVTDLVAHRNASVPFETSDDVLVEAATLNGKSVEPVEAEAGFTLTERTDSHRCILWWKSPALTDGDFDVPFPRPAGVDYSHSDVVVLQDPARYSFVRGSAVRLENSELLDKLAAADAESGSQSPVAMALLAAGVAPAESTLLTESLRSKVVSIRLPATATAFRIYSFDRQLVHLSVLLVGSFLFVMFWLVLGPWINFERLSRNQVSASSIGMLSVGLAVWFWGNGLAAVPLILAGGWQILRDLRNVRARPAVDSP